MGVDALEMDLRVSADGVFVLMHDDAVERTTNRTGRVVEMSVAELQALDAGFRFADNSGNLPFRDAGLTVPRLEEVLRQMPEARINLEMKEFIPEQARGLCTVLRRHHALEQVLVSAFDHAPMAAFREACPEVATGATRREVIAFYALNRLGLGRLFRSPAVTLQVPFRYRGRAIVTPWLLETSRRSNRRVQVWTVNDETEMEHLLELGVQAIMTDRPDWLLALLGRPPARGRCGRPASGGGEIGMTRTSGPRAGGRSRMTGPRRLAASVTVNETHSGKSRSTDPPFRARP